MTRSLHRRGPRRRTLVLSAVLAIGAAFVLVPAFRRPPAFPRHPGPPNVRFATYNIRAGLGGLSGIESDLEALHADIIALQEAEKGIYGSKVIDQARSLAGALGMNFEYAPSFSLEGREHGIAILSRYPLSEARTIPLPQGSGRWPRVALGVRAETPSGPIRVVCLHLTRPAKMPHSHTRERLSQLRAVFSSIQGDSLPRVLAGDFNSTPISPERWLIGRHLEDSWAPWRDGWLTTFALTSVGYPWGSVKIDAIFHERRLRSSGTWVAPRGASDHRAVVADLHWPDPKP